MDEFDRSPEDISFDLNAEEFSLESILDEYKDFQTEKPAPRPRPAYRSRPVTAEMIEEAEAADAETEDILVSAELDSALDDAESTQAQTAPVHEDHDVKRYQPKRQRDMRPRPRSKSGTRRRPAPSVWHKKGSQAQELRLQTLGGRAR